MVYKWCTELKKMVYEIFFKITYVWKPFKIKR